MPKKTKIFGISIVILSVILSFLLADLFSSLITVGDFAFLTTQSTKSNGYTIYAISLNKTLSLSEANNLIDEVQQKNAAGFVYKSDNIYYLLASGYENKSDAENVLKHLAESKTDAEIISIKIKKIEIDMNLKNSEKNTMIESLNIFKTTYQSLYDISVSLDTKLKTKTECKLLINNLQANVIKVQSNFDTQFNSKLNTKLLSIKLSLNKVVNSLQTLIDESDSDLFSSYIKNTYLNVIKINKDLAEDINT